MFPGPGRCGALVDAQGGADQLDWRVELAGGQQAGRQGGRRGEEGEGGEGGGGGGPADGGGGGGGARHS